MAGELEAGVQQVPPQQAHNDETTSIQHLEQRPIQRWFNVKTSNQRWIDVVSTLYACWDLFTFSHYENTLIQIYWKFYH